MRNRTKLTACLEGWYDDDYRINLTHTGTAVQEHIQAAEKNGALFADYHGDFLEMRPKGILDDGTMTYVISPVDESDKYSRGYANCTGLVAVGTDAKTGRNISLLSHQDPTEFLHGCEHHEPFVRDITLRLAELRERSEPDRLDAMIVGGMWVPYHAGGYLSSILLLRAIVRETLAFFPDCATGPKFCNYGSDDVLIATTERRVFISRPHLDGMAQSFSSRNIESLIENKWRIKR